MISWHQTFSGTVRGKRGLTQVSLVHLSMATLNTVPWGAVAASLICVPWALGGLVFIQGFACPAQGTSHLG